LQAGPKGPLRAAHRNQVAQSLGKSSLSV
jgi:hypothetical protein